MEDSDLNFSKLAASLHHLGLILREVDRFQEALTATEQAVVIRRELAAAEPDLYRPRLADSLHNLGIDLNETGRQGEALAATEQALAIRRELAMTEPDLHRHQLANCLHQLAVVQRRLDGTDSEGALHAKREAVALWKVCAECDPELYMPAYREAVATLRLWLNQAGHHEEAIALGLSSDPPS